MTAMSYTALLNSFACLQKFIETLPNLFMQSALHNGSLLVKLMDRRRTDDKQTHETYM